MDYKAYEVRIYENGNKFWYLNNKRHREDGPAIEYANGDKHWYLNDQRHRTDGPAIEWTNGNKYWYLNGQLHREDGPAIEWTNGTKLWLLNGKELTEQEFLAQQSPSTCEGKIVEVDGKKYRLQAV